jgi:hypothetical protein
MSQSNLDFFQATPLKLKYFLRQSFMHLRSVNSQETIPAEYSIIHIEKIYRIQVIPQFSGAIHT